MSDVIARRAPCLLVVALGVALAVTVGCSRSEAAPAGASSAGSAATTAAAAPSASAVLKGFGAACVDDAECAGTVCFHKRLKTAQSSPERRGGNDAVEHDGYCSMHCEDDGQCPAPPTSGRCGTRGMCKRPE